MLLKIIFTIFVALTAACGTETGTNRDRSTRGSGGLDALPTEGEVRIDVDSYKMIEKYDSNGELLSTTEFYYGSTPIHPSYEVKNSDGEITKNVEVATDDSGLILQRKTSVKSGGKSVVKVEDYQRNESGSVEAYIVDNNGRYRRVEYLLANDGKEIRSEVFDASGALLSEREIDWESNEITFYDFDESGTPSLEWVSSYLKLEMVSGELIPIFNVSQRRDNLLDDSKSTRLDGECDFSSSPVKCKQINLTQGEKADNETVSSFYVVPIDNGFFKRHLIKYTDMNEKVFSNNALKKEMSRKYRYDEEFNLKSTTEVEREIGSDVNETETLYFYDAESRLLAKEVRINGDLEYKEMYGY